MNSDRCLCDIISWYLWVVRAFFWVVGGGPGYFIYVDNSDNRFWPCPLPSLGSFLRICPVSIWNPWSMPSVSTGLTLNSFSAHLHFLPGYICFCLFSHVVLNLYIQFDPLSFLLLLCLLWCFWCFFFSSFLCLHYFTCLLLGF